MIEPPVLEKFESLSFIPFQGGLSFDLLGSFHQLPVQLDMDIHCRAADSRIKASSVLK